jgi:hypothetical protein
MPTSRHPAGTSDAGQPAGGRFAPDLRGARPITAPDDQLPAASFDRPDLGDEHLPTLHELSLRLAAEQAQRAGRTGTPTAVDHLTDQITVEQGAISAAQTVREQLRAVPLERRAPHWATAMNEQALTILSHRGNLARLERERDDLLQHPETPDLRP